MMPARTISVDSERRGRFKTEPGLIESSVKRRSFQETLPWWERRNLIVRTGHAIE